MFERYAIYVTLPQDSTLYHKASQWFSYDAYQGDSPTIEYDLQEELRPLLPYSDYNSKASQYGFHGTLKAPFRLKNGIKYKSLQKMMKHFCRLTSVFHCVGLEVKQIDNFLALVPKQDCKKIIQLSKDSVQTFDVFRAALTSDEIDKRQPNKLSDNQRLMLKQWGYPYVLDEFRFHMTLTDRLTQPQIDTCKPLLEEYFKECLRQPLRIGQLSLCYQSSEYSSFVILDSFPLHGEK